MRQLQRNLRPEKQAIFNAAGIATATMFVPPGPSWELKQIAIKCTGNVNETTCETFVGTNASGVFISNSYTGNSDTDSEPNVTLRSGDAVTAVWTGGTVGAIAKMTVVYDEVAY